MTQETEGKPAPDGADRRVQERVQKGESEDGAGAGSAPADKKPARLHAKRHAKEPHRNKRAEKANPAQNGERPQTSQQPRWKSVDDLPQELRELIDRMLTKGSTFEDVLDAVEKMEPNSISRAAVEIYFRSNTELQQKRVQAQIEAARKLKDSCAGPDSAQSELAQAMIMTGLTGLSRATTASESEYALRSKAQSENYRLKEQVLQLQIQKSALDSEMLKVRIRHESEKLRLVAGKAEQLQKMLERQSASKTLTPEMLQRIEEIYGIATEDSSDAASE
jgi:hypothetical protein